MEECDNKFEKSPRQCELEEIITNGNKVILHKEEEQKILNVEIDMWKRRVEETARSILRDQSAFYYENCASMSTNGDTTKSTDQDKAKSIQYLRELFIQRYVPDGALNIEFSLRLFSGINLTFEYKGIKFELQQYAYNAPDLGQYNGKIVLYEVTINDYGYRKLSMLTHSYYPEVIKSYAQNYAEEKNKE